MDTPELTKLERCLRALPILSVDDMVVSETIYGPLYMAWGRDMHNDYHGIWGMRGIARPLHFKPNTTLPMVKAVLYTDAMGLIEGVFNVGLPNEESFNA